MMKIEGSASGSGSGSIRQRHGSADPDPHKNVMDPQHRYNLVLRRESKREKFEKVWILLANHCSAVIYIDSTLPGSGSGSGSNGEKVDFLNFSVTRYQLQLLLLDNSI
jgi:hypothetical protein